MTNQTVLKRGILTVLTVLGLTFTSNAQSIRVGMHAGIPVGDAADVSSFNFGLDASMYFLGVNDWLNIGVATGYTHFFGKEETVDGVDVDYESFGYIPVAASARGTFGKGIFYTADIGYGIGTNDADGGLYYQGKLGWSDTHIDVFAFYRGVSADEFDATSIGAGIAFKVF